MRMPTMFVAALLLVGCDSPKPLAPDPLIPVLSGTVYEYDASGRRAVPNFGLYVQPVGLVADPDVITDAAGQYRIYSAGPVEWFARANTRDHLQPCYASAIPQPGTILDVHVLTESTLLAVGIPASMPIAEPSVTGRIIERTPTGDQPVKGARVGSGGFTKSDGDGRYLLCNVKSGHQISVLHTGYLTVFATIDLSHSTTYDFVLTPQ